MEKPMNSQQEELKSEEISQDQVESQKEPEENVSCETQEELEGLKISFDPRFNDIFDGLNATDTADGTNKKTDKLYFILFVLMIMQILWVAYSRNGFAFIFVILLGGMAIVLKKKSQRFNREIAKAFEEEGTQNLIFGDSLLRFNDKEISYDEIDHFYNLKRCYSVIYQTNHVYIIPKSVLSQEENQQLLMIVDEKIPQAYEDKTRK